MTKLYLRTLHDAYHILENGNIQRLDRQNVANDSWRFVGLRHVRRHEFIPLCELTPERVRTLSLTFKNGKPRYTVRDFDHGTIREWGNGVSDLHVVD